MIGYRYQDTPSERANNPRPHSHTQSIILVKKQIYKDKTIEYSNMASRNNIWDFRCYATGQLVKTTKDERALKMVIRLHKKKCATCRQYDDNRVHRFSHQVNNIGRNNVITHTYDFQDTNYENGVSPHQVVAAGDFAEIGQTTTGGQTSVVGNAVETSLNGEDYMELVKGLPLRKRR